jgi:hypothetical protein
MVAHVHQRQSNSALPSFAFTSTADNAVFASDAGKVPKPDITIARKDC